MIIGLRTLVVVSAIVALASHAARGGILVHGGTLDAQGSASAPGISGGTVSSSTNSPDVNFVAPQQHAFISGGASVSGVTIPAAAHVFAAAGTGEPTAGLPLTNAKGLLFVSGSGAVSAPFGPAFASASASGTLSFTVTETETFVTEVTDTTYFFVQVTIKDAQDATVATFFDTPGTSNLTLPAGSYTLNFSTGPHVMAGTGGGGSSGWRIVPEPSSAAPALLCGASLVRRRRCAELPETALEG